MNKIILQKLAEVEQKYNVTILYACETGSRAWGFPSPDSDYDVRFVYALKDYLMIDDTRDVIEYQVDETWDITGWDLRKALRLFRGTNSAMIERLYSPITYINCGDFKQQLLALTPQYYAPKSGMYHYLSMTRNLFEKDLQGADIRLKKYFYALRTSLAALWIAQNQSAPPMTLGELRINLPTHLNSVVDDMIALKSVSNEQKIVTPNDGLHRFIQNTIEICQVVASQFQEHFNDSSDLNRLFKNTLAQI